MDKYKKYYGPMAVGSLITAVLLSESNFKKGIQRTNIAEPVDIGSGIKSILVQTKEQFKGNKYASDILKGNLEIIEDNDEEFGNFKRNSGEAIKDISTISPNEQKEIISVMNSDFGGKMKGFLFGGVAGTGKTRLAKAMCYDGNMIMLNIDQQTLSGRQEEVLEKIKAVFDIAKYIASKKQNCMILFDEFDSIFKPRKFRSDNVGNLMGAALTNFLLIEANKKTDSHLYVVGTTNKQLKSVIKDDVETETEDAILSRMPVKIYFGKLSPEKRKEIVEKIVKNYEKNMHDDFKKHYKQLFIMKASEKQDISPRRIHLALLVINSLITTNNQDGVIVEKIIDGNFYGKKRSKKRFKNKKRSIKRSKKLRKRKKSKKH